MIVGKEFIVTVATAVPEQPFASVPVTVYEVVLVGVTVIGFRLTLVSAFSEVLGVTRKNGMISAEVCV